MPLTPVPNSEAHNIFILTSLIWIFLAAYWIFKYSKISYGYPADKSQPVPYEAAYMKKGRNHAVTVCLFDLIQRGYIVVDEAKDLTATGNTEGLNTAENALIDTVRVKSSIAGIFAQRDQLKRFEYYTLRSLTVKGLIKDSKETNRFCKNLRMFAIISAIALTAVNLYLEFPAGEGMMLFSLLVPAIAFISSYVMQRTTIKTNRGKAYLTHLENKIAASNHVSGSDGHYDPTLSYAVAVLGMAVLAGTVFSGISEAIYYHGGAAGSSGGCSGCSSGDIGSGSSCSGCSSGDSGGDSGGCSGCGGGGGD
ncbi:MAG: TIGR04222 domain-containing membrane protein [Nitrospirae bacterium]|nr:TIGR04222 domain-containing membrane protein [Nitrospirota bacterium]MBF0534677.1 TIGR04222 domain-containing membrane protein [Nitrospirota bacterium]MBF0616279.1 TIGR04222 domain-containing membrane protein [Nitrospirota bacterium]